MTADDPRPPLLKLRAQDAEDLQVVSAILQDAIVPVCDMVYRPEDGGFVMVAQRLRREATEPDRICCALTVRGVTSAQTHGLDLEDQERILDLLAIIVERETGTLQLVFAGDVRVRLKAGDWSARLEDFGEPWPALCQPRHDVAPNA